MRLVYYVVGRWAEAKNESGKRPASDGPLPDQSRQAVLDFGRGGAPECSRRRVLLIALINLQPPAHGVYFPFGCTSGWRISEVPCCYRRPRISTQSSCNWSWRPEMNAGKEGGCPISENSGRCGRFSSALEFPAFSGDFSRWMTVKLKLVPRNEAGSFLHLSLPSPSFARAEWHVPDTSSGSHTNTLPTLRPFYFAFAFHWPSLSCCGSRGRNRRQGASSFLSH